MSIPLPTTIDITETEENRATITISPCYPGYGTTLGNALRRVLLSSLPGAAITAVKIKGVEHEFSTLEHVKEDVVEIILDLKQLRLRMHSDEPVELELNASGETVVTAEMFEKNSQVEIMNPDQKIATLTDKAAEFEMKVIIEPGRGYVPVEDRDTEALEIGYIAIDSVFTPIRNVNYSTEHVRVGQMTNYDKLLLDISTDGTMTSEEAFRAAATILVEQFQTLTGDIPVVDEPPVDPETGEQKLPIEPVEASAEEEPDEADEEKEEKEADEEEKED